MCDGYSLIAPTSTPCPCFSIPLRPVPRMLSSVDCISQARTSFLASDNGTSWQEIQEVGKTEIRISPPYFSLLLTCLQTNFCAQSITTVSATWPLLQNYNSRQYRYSTYSLGLLAFGSKAILLLLVSWMLYHNSFVHLTLTYICKQILFKHIHLKHLGWILFPARALTDTDMWNEQQ